MNQIGQVFKLELGLNLIYLLSLGMDETQLGGDIVLVYNENPINLSESELNSNYVHYGYTMLSLGVESGQWVKIGAVQHSLNKINTKKLVFKQFRDAEMVETLEGHKNAKPEWIVWSIKNKKMKRINFKKGEKLLAAEGVIFSPENFVSKITALYTEFSDEINSDQALIIEYAISDEFGNDLEQNMTFNLEDDLSKVVAELADSDVDGHEFGGGEAHIYIYGPSTDAIYEKVQPTLKAFLLKPVRVIRRYGEAADLNTKTKEDLIL